MFLHVPWIQMLKYFDQFTFSNCGNVNQNPNKYFNLYLSHTLKKHIFSALNLISTFYHQLNNCIISKGIAKPQSCETHVIARTDQRTDSSPNYVRCNHAHQSYCGRQIHTEDKLIQIYYVQVNYNMSSLFLCLSLSLYLSLSLSLSLIIHIFVCLSLSLSVYLSI